MDAKNTIKTKLEALKENIELRDVIINQLKEDEARIVFGCDAFRKNS
jgi:hypothetical protein